MGAAPRRPREDSVIIPNMNNRTAPKTAPRPFILVVDGDADTRQLYREMFTAEGYIVEECDDGAEALGVAICRTPDLIVMETLIRRIDGFALCQLLRKDVATRLVPIVVVTAAATGGERARARAAGADLVFAKPFKLEEVVETVQQLLERSSGGAQPTVDSAAPSQPHVLTPAVNHRRESRSFARTRTTTPPAAPPALRCPACDASLRYSHSQLGGVSARQPEQWDYFECGRCGTYQYRHRTRLMRIAG